MTRRAILLGACPALLAWQNDEPHRVGKGVGPPRLVSKVEPEYSEEARKARLNGAVLLYAVVRPDGHADSFKVIRSLGLGLDENAMAAVGQWRFQPGMKEGQAVSVQATIEVNFRLLPNHAFEAGWYTGRVAFQTPSGADRPTLQFAKFPPNGDPPEPGSVTISCLIDEQGMPTALRVEKSSAQILDAEALGFVRQWRFNPAMQGGKPVAVPATIEAVFGSVSGPAKPKAPNSTL